MNDSIPKRYQLRVKQRRRVVQYAELHGLRPASRHFGLARRTVRAWCRRWTAEGETGLVPRYPARRKRRMLDTTVELIRIARVEHRWGATRTQVWLQRVHQLRLNTKTIHRVFREIGVPLLTKTRPRAPRQMKLFEKDAPGDSIQVDVKIIKLQREKVFQYTALDDCTRLRVLRLYPRLNQHSSLAFLRELRDAFPFAIKKLQCDNGSEFPLAFKLAVEAAGIRHRYIKPRRPQQNGKVERSHRIDDEEFWSLQTFARRHDAEGPLTRWEQRYNEERFSIALHGLTPVEKLKAKLTVAPVVNAPISEAVQ